MTIVFGRGYGLIFKRSFIILIFLFFLKRKKLNLFDLVHKVYKFVNVYLISAFNLN